MGTVDAVTVLAAYVPCVYVKKCNLIFVESKNGRFWHRSVGFFPYIFSYQFLLVL